MLIPLKYMDPNIIVDNKNFISLFHDACIKNNIKLVNLLLLNSKINVNCVDFGGKTGLHIACNNGYINIITILLSNSKINE